MVISPTLRDKIERRSGRAFRRFDEGDTHRVHRVTGVGKSSLTYRISRRRSQSVEVTRDDNGTIIVDPPTTGLIDVLTQADLKRLKNHAGEVRAYILSDKNKKVGKTYKKADTLQSYGQCVGQVKLGQHVYGVDLHGSDVKDVTYSGFTAKPFTVVDELDLVADLGFTEGIYDCLVKKDVEKLRSLKKHLGKIRAYKYTTKEGKSPIRTGPEAITYEVGKDYEIKDADVSPASACHKGINLADVEWTKNCAKHGDKRVFAFEFEVDDIAAVPTSTDGKFRVRRCKCVEELDPKTFKPLKLLPAPVDKPKKKKKGFMDKLLGRGDEDDA